ncbi:hypothetical protein [Sphingobacterium sp.]|uniref:hypothetical protein n=1 Tax=Sphingobacterium sp. TaxID=341027 RepID=UPI002FDC9161
MITQLYDRSNRKLVLLYPTFSNIDPKGFLDVLPEAVQSIVSSESSKFIYHVLYVFLKERETFYWLNKSDKKLNNQIKALDLLVSKIKGEQLPKIIALVSKNIWTLYDIAPPADTNFYSDFITKVFPVIHWCKQMDTMLNKTPVKRNPCQGRQG